MSTTEAPIPTRAVGDRSWARSWLRRRWHATTPAAEVAARQSRHRVSTAPAVATWTMPR